MLWPQILTSPSSSERGQSCSARESHKSINLIKRERVGRSDEVSCRTIAVVQKQPSCLDFLFSLPKLQVKLWIITVALFGKLCNKIGKKWLRYVYLALHFCNWRRWLQWSVYKYSGHLQFEKPRLLKKRIELGSLSNRRPIGTIMSC